MTQQKRQYSLTNSSKFSDKLIHQLVRFACKGWEHKLNRIRTVVIRGSNNRHSGHASGHAYVTRQKICVTVSNDCSLELLAELVVHEIGHCATFWKERFESQKKSRRSGKAYGGSERFICRNTKYIIEDGIPLSAKRTYARDMIAILMPPPKKETALEKRLRKSRKGVSRTQEKIVELRKSLSRAEKRLTKYSEELAKAERATARKEAKQS